MGVQGLWEILQPTAESRSLAHLAVVDGFESNSSERRAFRIGIDASLWYQHASGWVRYAKRDIGANPDVRTLFFRLCNLSELPIILLFVFDGRQRPKVKRGSKKGKSGSHNLTQKMKEMLNVFGMEWRMALGEAEAELAHLNRVGVIDAIMTDDADAFLFGARAIIRNPSLSLTGNRNDPAVNMEGKASQHHVKIFTADAIRNHPAVRLTRGGMILIALLSGGDYDHGIQNCGPQIAHGLALCGFGDQLLAAYECGAGHFKAFLPQWRAEVNQELRTNSQGKFETRHAGISIPGTFPDPAVMEAYANPPLLSARPTLMNGATGLPS
ncbi:hypothetical protein NM688_g8897 [Phlebia brevispora]|uniref:Uncharacterized protein n=1 Tax=Phlebia brevispora TaxID=194682 RepID=A0ACC1RLQ8_9APHY|nr:hypothetical protein NM688_g8897 [Phlebia brevispora]